MDTVKSINVAGATIVVQVCMFIIVMLGVVLTPLNFHKRHIKKSTAYLITLLLAIISLMTIVDTRDFYAVWSPILGDLTLPTIASATGLVFVFVLDLIAVSILMLGTGGSKESPFTSVLFMVPALAIFLREPPRHFVSYAISVAVVYMIGLRIDANHQMAHVYSVERDNPSGAIPALRSKSSLAYAAVNLACLALAMLTGYITRPLPI